ncbi:MAG: superoxide dismutase family protein [Egibacteraceae bacterium]
MSVRLTVLLSLILLLAASVLVVQSQGAAAQDPASGPESLTVDMHAVDGTDVGRVVFKAQEGRTRVEATLRNLPPGFHGFHIHDVGVCDPDAPDGPFTSAAGHYVGDGGRHGDHDGDLPSLLVMQNGNARLEFVTDRFTLAELQTGDSSAVMIHAGRDNFANIPDRYSTSGESGPDEATLSTGDAGSRLACGAIPERSMVEEGAGLITVTSELSVPRTVRRILRDVREVEGLRLIELVDHGRAARRAGLELPPTVLLIVANPAVGTPLMQASRTVAIDLPQKLLVWEDDGQTKVTYNDPAYLKARHGIEGQDELLANIAGLLRQLATGEMDG